MFKKPVKGGAEKYRIKRAAELLRCGNDKNKGKLSFLKIMVRCWLFFFIYFIKY
jgi:hypothetical protein